MWRELLSASSSSSWSRSLNFPTSLSPTFQLLRRHSLGFPGEHQLGSNARACGRRRLGMWAPKPGAKGSSPCKVGGPAGATVGEGLFGAPVVHSWRRLWDHAGCILGTGALLQTMRPPPRVALWVRFGGGLLFQHFALVRQRPAPLAIWLHLPVLWPQGRDQLLAPADLSPAQPGLETWHILGAGHCLQ